MQCVDSPPNSSRILARALGTISGGRVLDVATGEGAFIVTLVGTLESYTEIIGIDTLAYSKAAGSIFGAAKVHFCRMDAARLGFEDRSFDTVSISSALHHLESIPRCLAEMDRVLKPEGHWIIRETHQGVQTEAQRTDMVLHHWVAGIDAALGFTHNQTLTRQALVELVQSLRLDNVAFYDILNTDMDPAQDAAIRETKEAIADYLVHASGLPGYQAFKRRGKALLRRLHEVGIQWEPELLVVGEKERQ
jgi:ubiquinone/menaquinone biosynthesis C-methylase UbiE